MYEQTVENKHILNVNIKTQWSVLYRVLKSSVSCKFCFSFRCYLIVHSCAADFSLLNLPKGKSLGCSKPATNS